MARLEIRIPDDMLAEWHQAHIATMSDHKITSFSAWIRAIVDTWITKDEEGSEDERTIAE